MGKLWCWITRETTLHFTVKNFELKTIFADEWKPDPRQTGDRRLEQKLDKVMQQTVWPSRRSG
ncbi:hypothetical protein KCP78_20815 [Salmonella enterica subsp. enterica]|nr:hypothetical protein KCP78_20815 [Salmonella enterica subsp. enterica]